MCDSIRLPRVMHRSCASRTAFCCGEGSCGGIPGSLGSRWPAAHHVKAAGGSNEGDQHDVPSRHKDTSRSSQCLIAAESSRSSHRYGCPLPPAAPGVLHALAEAHAERPHDAVRFEPHTRIARRICRALLDRRQSDPEYDQRAESRCC